MRSTRVILIAAIALVSSTMALANERGVVIRAGDLFAELFVDAAKLGPWTSNQLLTIVERKGGWRSTSVGGAARRDNRGAFWLFALWAGGRASDPDCDH